MRRHCWVLIVPISVGTESQSTCASLKCFLFSKGLNVQDCLDWISFTVRRERGRIWDSYKSPFIYKCCRRECVLRRHMSKHTGQARSQARCVQHPQIARVNTGKIKRLPQTPLSPHVSFSLCLAWCQCHHRPFLVAESSLRRICFVSRVFLPSSAMIHYNHISDLV